jgi:hypothetical protein
VGSPGIGCAAIRAKSSTACAGSSKAIHLALAPDELMDHAPLPYATGLWNAHEDTRLH